MNRMFWLDLEMTGLLPEKDRIIEAAVVVTDLHLSVLDTYETAVFQSQELLAGMDPWCTETHGKSGLTERVPNGITETELDKALVWLVKKNYKKDKVIICGNSIHQDRKFIEKYLPEFTKELHYRMLDVSSLKIVFENMFSLKFKKSNKHRALEDIEESIKEFKYYLSFLDKSRLNLDFLSN